MKVVSSKRLKARIGLLKERHAALEASLKGEMGRPLPDHLRVSALKQMKLRAKDEIQRMLGVLRTISRPDRRPMLRKRAAS